MHMASLEPSALLNEYLQQHLQLQMRLLRRLHFSCAATFRAAAKLNKICVASKREFSALHLLPLLLGFSSFSHFPSIFIFWSAFGAVLMHAIGRCVGWAWHRFALSNAICSWLCQLEQHYLHFLFCPNAKSLAFSCIIWIVPRVVLVVVVVAVCVGVVII